MMKNNLNVGIIDYGLGNLFSIERAIKYIGANPIITSDPDTIISCNRLILPGVGAFGDGMKGLQERELIEVINLATHSGKPLLGICLGMQLLMSVSEEFGIHKGLDLIKGRVTRFKEPNTKGPFFKIPHIGWNSLHYFNNHKNNWRKTILEDLREGDFVYFVHSYIVAVDNPEYILAITRYGNDEFCSVISNRNIMGCQFHPERSGDIGLSIYRKFVFGNF